MLQATQRTSPTLAEFFGIDEVTFREIDLSRYAHLIIDPQKEFADPKYYSKDAGMFRGNEETDRVSRRIAGYTHRLRESGLLQIFLHVDDKEEGFETAYGGFHEITPDLLKDIIVPKPDNDGFYDSKLAEILEQRQISGILASGFNREVCYKKTVLSGLRRRFKFAVIEDGVGQDSNLPNHINQNAIQRMEREGALITRSEPVLETVEQIALAA